MFGLANPGQFQRFAARLLPWSALLTVVLLVWGLVEALVISPPDYVQGQSVRIMYVHVPAAWMSLMVYTSMAVAAASALVWKHPLAHLYVRAAAPLGAGFTLLCLVSGSLWGAPTWGTWWAWDARLTSELILFFLYLGAIALGNAFDDPERGAKASAVLVLVGVVNIPIIKFSVDWWNTLHQPASVIRLSGSTIAVSMLWPLLLMAGAFTSYFITVVLMRLCSEILARRINALRVMRG